MKLKIITDHGQAWTVEGVKSFEVSANNENLLEDKVEYNPKSKTKPLNVIYED